jgi:hypothetical protein
MAQIQVASYPVLKTPGEKLLCFCLFTLKGISKNTPPSHYKFWREAMALK